MSISLPTNLSTRQGLLLTAFASAIATSTLILSFQNLRREHRTEKLKKQVGEDVEEWERSREGSGFTSPEERAEWHANGETTPGGGRRVKEWAKGEFDEGLIREQVGLRALGSLLRGIADAIALQLTRNYNFLGEEAMKKVRDSYVVVVGCGGVGSWAALMLLRRQVDQTLARYQADWRTAESGSFY